MARRNLTLWWQALTGAVHLLGAGCGEGEEWTRPPPEPDAELFVNEVYPMLLRDCAFAACHGGPERFLQVFGPGRVRLDRDRTLVDDPIRLAEVRHSYDRARSLLASDSKLEESLLLSKPLELTAGGQSHEGSDDFGWNVFRSIDDPRYELLLRWAESRGSAPTSAQVSAARDAIAEALAAMQESTP